MEKSLATSEKEADSAEKKLELMEGVINKLKAGAEDLYVEAKVGSTPVLSLLGDMKKVARKHVLTFLINNINVNYCNRSGNFTQTGDTEHNEIKYNHKDIFINSGRGQNSGAPFRYGKQRHHVPGHDPREDCGVEGCRTVLGLEEGDQDGGIAAVAGGSAGQGDAGL